MRRVIWALSAILLCGHPTASRTAWAETIQRAAPIDQPTPSYPDSAGEVEGYVKLSFTITTDGHVKNVVVMDSSPKAVFDQAALDAIALWTYKPALRDGQAIEQPDNKIMLRFKAAPPSLQRTLVYSPSPSYPESAYEAKQEGTVKVAFNVTPEGAPANVHATEATLPAVFDDAAVNSVKQWAFEPVPANSNPELFKEQSTLVRFTLANARVSPKPINRKPPIYPSEAEEQGVIGSCNVNFIIRADGTVADPKIEACFPAGYFEQASLTAIKDWTFEPGHGPGGNIAMPAKYTLRYLFDGMTERDGHYLKPGQWVKLKYTLSETGEAHDIQVIDKSDPSIPAVKAIYQLRHTKFAPIIEYGKAVEKPDQEIRIVDK